MSPSPPPPTSPATPFCFPGPSSKFNSRERPAAHHTRHHSAYIPTAPVLSTEKRAHRRAHTSKGSISSLPSPPSSRSGESYARNPLSRSSYSASLAIMAASRFNAPITPAKTSRRNSSVQNSPFSDYFTDDARSIESSTAQTSATKQLLVRMNRIQAQLLSDHSDAGRDAIRLVGKKLEDIGQEISALQGRTRVPFSVEDSAVFTDEDGMDSKRARPSGDLLHEPYLHGMDGSTDFPPEPVTIEQYKAERDWFIIRTQELLDGLRYTQSELGRRFEEVRQLNEEHNAQIEEHETQIEQLRSENEGLRSDLGFEYSELLFLKLQVKSLEVDIDAMSEDTTTAPETTVGKAQLAKKNRILSEMDRWRSDWQDVNSRFKRRRSRHGVSLDRRHSSLSAPSEDSPPPSSDSKEVEWHLQTVKEGHGRITSLTIKRMDSRSETRGPDEVVVGADDNTPKAARTQNLAELDGTARDGIVPTSLTTSETLAAAAQQQQQQHQPTDPDGQAQRPRELQIARRPPAEYKEHGTQTDLFPPMPWPDPREMAEEEEEEEGVEDIGEDCAITTSSEVGEMDFSDGGDEDEAATLCADPVVATSYYNNKPKTPWQEFMDSVANGMGMGDDMFDD